MRLRPYQALFINLIFLFSSCDPGIGVLISNHTKESKHIQAKYPNNASFRYWISRTDSLMIYDAAANESKNIPILNNDTVNSRYEFDVPAGRSVLLEHHMGTHPTYGQSFLIDRRDTIRLTEKNGDFRKKPKLLLGGAWIYTIKEKN
jgi:hypothetical protein